MAPRKIPASQCDHWPDALVNLLPFRGGAVKTLFYLLTMLLAGWGRPDFD